MAPCPRRAAVIRSWAIPVAFVPDSRPLLGPVDGVAGLLVATGLKSTIILTPLVGEFVAGMVTGATQDPGWPSFRRPGPYKEISWHSPSSVPSNSSSASPSLLRCPPPWPRSAHDASCC